MSKHGDAGNGDICPLFPEHGRMTVLDTKGAPKQWCPHQTHDGGVGKQPAPKSRNLWPLYGFEDTVNTYLARLDHAIARAELPDLSTLEVL